MYIYIYIYREREREREKDRQRYIIVAPDGSRTHAAIPDVLYTNLTIISPAMISNER